jgi:hypothetical protein
MYLDAVSGSVNIIVWTGNDTLLWLLSEIKADIKNYLRPKPFWYQEYWKECVHCLA